MKAGKTSIYLFPMVGLPDLERKHPYISGVAQSLSGKYIICNLGEKSKFGIFGLLKYSLNTDVLYLNWVENVASWKFGVLQVFFAIFITAFFRLMGRTVVWTHHNVSSHSGQNFWNTLMVKYMMWISTHIIIHTLESKKYIKSKFWHKLKYFYHPISDFSNPGVKSGEKKFDVLIWGAVRRSKGVEVFLKYLADSGQLERYRIHIVGRISDQKLRGEILSYKGSKILVEDRFVSDTELHRLHASARCVLYFYTGDSVLVSGAMVRSLPLGTPIIGPHKGAFIDLSEAKLIHTYRDFEDIISLLDGTVVDKINHEQVRSFVEAHTWENFGKFISKVLGNG